MTGEPDPLVDPWVDPETQPATPPQAQQGAQPGTEGGFGEDLPMPLDPSPGPVLRRLRLRGGPWDGATWTGEIAIGFQIACGTRPWPPSSMYVVTAEEVVSPAGVVEFVAVPAEPGPEPASI